jgi:valyl-tRNA synthetase
MIEKYDNGLIEQEFMDKWERDGVYKYDDKAKRENTFALDSPPPTVSGSLHIGHIFGYTQADIMARFHRMNGKNIFFPMGWDDNGLPTERRVQNYFNIKCDPKLQYDPNFVAVHKDKFDEPQKPISRQNFIEHCRKLIDQDEKVFENIFRKMGMSYDWSLMYSTISSDAIKLAQESFINLYKSGNVKSVDSPTMWDTTFQTAVAQAEIEDREMPGFFHDIKFGSDAGDFIIATTRPEFLPACIAIVAHPDDPRYKHLIGKMAHVPLFNTSVPIFGDPHADPERGTGIMMVCTFGDAEDVKFWKEHNLPLKQIIGRDGRILDSEFITRKELVGLPVKAARKQIVEWLRESGELVDEPKPITHAVKFYEKGDVPIEFIPSRQWFVSILDKKNDLIAAGNKIKWTPEHMRSRFINWTENLNQNWAISRQRFFGIPFPVWYRLDTNGEPLFDAPILATTLPCDPLSQCPTGFSEADRGQPNGFIGDPDVMDTWATSALTPKIAMQKKPGCDLDVPFDSRWNGHDIIRTWDFYTILVTMLNNNGKTPWKELWVNGFVLDPDRKKMSKSKGNVVVPSDLIEKYGSDAIRLWAASAKWGTDGINDEKVMEQKRKLVVKFFNAAKFVFSVVKDHGSIDQITNSLDLAFVKSLFNVCASAEKSFGDNDYTNALIASEQAFWDFCDNYIEIAKARAYSGDISAMSTFALSLDVFCGLFAPFMPFITDTVWGEWHQGSIHTVLFPTKWDAFKKDISVKTEFYTDVCDLVKLVRGKKSDANLSMKAPVKTMTIADTETMHSAENDIKNVLSAGDIIFDGNNILGELNFDIQQ